MTRAVQETKVPHFAPFRSSERQKCPDLIAGQPILPRLRLRARTISGGSAGITRGGWGGAGAGLVDWGLVLVA
jgi:hypothetical protein